MCMCVVISIIRYPMETIDPKTTQSDVISVEKNKTQNPSSIMSAKLRAVLYYIIYAYFFSIVFPISCYIF